MEYNFKKIEEQWQQKWKDEDVYKVPNISDKPKYYVLDMFPYPSGAGLHVGHPLGYIASDIFARYKRLKGFNVLHPMGYDAFGLPAEQYAIEHGVHPAVSTAKNIQTFRSQLDKIGFSFDWSREVNTSHPNYYKWTQWIFLQLFKSWYNRRTQKTEPIAALIKIFEEEGNANHPIPNAQFFPPNSNVQFFSAAEWRTFDETTQQLILMEYRVAYCGFGEVNWCEALGTVLANDEVVNGVSERGGHPVIKKRLRQWYLRITEYADRLLQGLQTVDFSEAMKEMQSNWIGKSSGAEVTWDLLPTSSEVGGAVPGIRKAPHWNTANSTYHSIKDFRKEIKDKPTEAENILWQYLRNKNLGVKFRRQHVIGGQVVDFVALEKKLVVELDGNIHENQEEADALRTSILEDHGFQVIRITNEEVFSNIEAAVKKIKTKLQSIRQTTSPGAFKVPTFGGDFGEVSVYTTRPDTIFGVDFLVLAPEHELVETITTSEQKKDVEEYIAYVKSRSERERMAEKKISGAFTGAYALHPFTGKEIPVWISEYVLAGYGTGAIMAVPSGDERDHKFAQHFGIPITNIFGEAYNGEEAVTSKNIVLQESDFLNGKTYKEAIELVIEKLEAWGSGHRKVNYKIRDAAFSRQRYWGEPFPIKWINGLAYPLEESELPLQLPQVETYKPGPEGEGPLANIPDWIHQEVKLDLSETNSSSFGGGGEGALETNTMPGYAGSSWYFLRYMDPHNEATFCDRSISDYWRQVDLYVGGTEHAVGHLLYSRMWTKCLYDLGLISFDEPFKKLLNQGMITGVSSKLRRISSVHKEPILNNVIIPSQTDFDSFYIRNNKTNFPEKEDAIKISLSTKTNNLYVSEASFPLFISQKDPYLSYAILSENSPNVDISLVDYGKLNIQRFYEESNLSADAVLITDLGYYQGGEFHPYFPESKPSDFYTFQEVEKMSKSKKNVVNPDEIIDKYGADTFRMYEMFLGPVEMSKPWDTKGIEGVHRFLKKLWRLFANEKGSLLSNEPPTPEELKVLHKTIKKIQEDTERFSFNTAVSAFMVCVNELTDLKCHKKQILESLTILLAPYAPHIAEELWHLLGYTTTILDADFPTCNEKYLIESSKEYPISVNGKLRTTMHIDLAAEQSEVERLVLQNEVIKKWLQGAPPKKIIFVKGKMVNVVTAPAAAS